MMDESDTEEDKRLDPAHCTIAKPSIPYNFMKPSLTNHNSVSFKRMFMPLPSTLKQQTSLDKSIHGTFLHPSREMFSTAKKKGFSSITITTRRYIASLSHAPKEITTDPASSPCRSNDLLMKASVSSDEHDQQCRYLDSAENYTRAPEPCGFFQSQELQQQSSAITLNYLNSIHNKNNSRLFISVVNMQKLQTLPGSIYYIDRFFFLPLGQLSNLRTYKSTISLKIQPRPGRPSKISRLEPPTLPAYAHCSYLTKPSLERNNKCKADQTKPPKSIHKTKCTEYKKYQESQKEQQNFYDHEECQEVSSYQDMKAFGLSQTLKQDSQPVCEIYLQRNASNLGPERPTVTTFNFIFGKQITNQEHNKQNLHKGKILVKAGHRWHKSCGNSKSFDKEKIKLPEIRENNKTKDLSREIMSLQEALEHHRPDFICNSQKRVHKLELMARQRKTQKQEAPNSRLPAKQLHLRKKAFTVPHPLSDNLFKPKERAISEREMQQRSRRIYNSLPEVKKKREDEEKRMIIQSNRLRAQKFKKKLLDQILQRTSD
ncbi:(E2-independent) E3 ubiquitin-conjugating enzyme FATS [Mantella aurantiaca]